VKGKLSDIEVTQTKSIYVFDVHHLEKNDEGI